MRSLPCETVDAASGMAYNEPGSACGLVSVRDFKSCGPAYGGPVGSIPTHFRQNLEGSEPCTMKRKQLLPSIHFSLSTGHCFSDDHQKAKAVPWDHGGQAAGALARGFPSCGADAC